MKLIKYFLTACILLSIFSCSSELKSSKKSLIPSLVKINGNYYKISHLEKLPNVITSYFNKPKFCENMVNPESAFNSSCGTRLVSAGN